MSKPTKPAAAARPLDPSPLAAGLPELAIVYRPAAELVPYEHNARTHSPDQIRTIQASMLEFGWTNPVLIDEQGILAGHGRLEAAKAVWAEGLSIPRVPDGMVPTVELAGLSASQRRAYILADNQIATQAGWDYALLKVELADLKGMGFDLATAGFAAADLTAIEQRPDEDLEDAEAARDPDAGELLALVNITIADPERKPEPGDHYLIRSPTQTHRLFCASVIEDWPAWSPFLTAGALFMPYPGTFVPYGKKADAHPLVLVQPDPYIAGHILDRWAECYGADAVTKVQPA